MFSAGWNLPIIPGRAYFGSGPFVQKGVVERAESDGEGERRGGGVDDAFDERGGGRVH
jgi:hypothetical protein